MVVSSTENGARGCAASVARATEVETTASDVRIAVVYVDRTAIWNLEFRIWNRRRIPTSEFLLPNSEVVPHIELRGAARAAIANRSQDQERRRIAAVCARHPSRRRGRVIEVRAVRDVEDVHVGHDAAVAGA